MAKINKDSVISLLIGIIIGIFCTGIFGLLAYKVIKSQALPKLFTMAKRTQIYQSPSGNKGLYLGFEKKADLDFFQAKDKSTCSLSTEHAATGKYSLMVKIMPDTGVPGILWEVYNKNVLDWEKAVDFHFDVYNNNEDEVGLYVRIKSGRDYPKEIFSEKVDLKPMSMNHISIPIADIAGTCNIKEISYIKLYVQSPDKQSVLYFDNIGTREPTKEDEISDIKKDFLAEKITAVKKITLKEGFDVYTASSLDRVFQDGKTLVKPMFSDKAEVYLAKNEYESFQVVVNNGREELKSVKLEITDCVNENTGTKIDRKNIDWRVVGYVETKKPYYSLKRFGMWPDPLLVQDNVDIEPGITQPFWIDVYAPSEVPAGSYKGSIRVLSGDRELKVVPILIRVYDFILPLESHLKTAFHLYEGRVFQRTPQGKNEEKETYSLRMNDVIEKYYISMLKHRMNPILNIDPSSQAELGRVDSLRRYGLNNFSIGKISGTDGNKWPETEDKLEELLPVYRGYGEALKFNKFLGYTYIYAWDEGPIGDIRVKKVCSMLHRAYPELKTMVCYHGFWEPEKEPGWGDDINIWCFQIDKFNERKMQVLKNRNMEIWMYVSGPSDSGAPNLALDFDSIDYRIIPWLCWRYDIKGFLYWCVNWWPNVDPFKSAMNTDWEQNGNGLMYYPGENGPIESLRLEVFRDGMEDYEYLQLLTEVIQKVKDKGLLQSNQELISSAEKLLNVSTDIVQSTTKFTKDTQLLMQRRQKIAETIEALEKTLKNE